MEPNHEETPTVPAVEVENLPITGGDHPENPNRSSDGIDRLADKIDPTWLRDAQDSLLAAIDLAGPHGATTDDAKHLCQPPRVACWWCIVPRTLRKQIEAIGASRGPQNITHCGLLRRWVRRADA